MFEMTLVQLDFQEATVQIIGEGNTMIKIEAKPKPSRVARFLQAAGARLSQTLAGLASLLLRAGLGNPRFAF